jgi:hypothetical protein
MIELGAGGIAGDGAPRPGWLPLGTAGSAR